MRMFPHPAYRRHFWLTVAGTALLGVLMLAAWGLPALQFRMSTPDTLALHGLLETASIAVSVMVFAASWHSPVGRGSSIRILTLASSVFASVALLDFVHTMTYQGMPEFLTPGYPGKAIGFFLAARLLTGLALLAIALTPPGREYPSSMRWWVLAVSLGFAALAIWTGLYRRDWLPVFLVPGQGLTAVKVYSEYLIVALNLAAAGLFYLRMREPQDYPVVPLFAASLVMAQSEIFFTLYATTTDQFIHLAHVHKVIAYFLIYLAIFVKSIRMPFQQLQTAENGLREANDALSEQRNRVSSIVESAMDAIVTVDDSFNVVVFNRAAEAMFGVSRGFALGRPLDTFIPARFRAAHRGNIERFGTENRTTRGMGRLAGVTAIRADGSEFPVEASISHAHVEGRQLFTVIMRDISARIADEQRIARLTMLYSALAKTNEAIVRIADWKALCDEVCRIIVENGGVAAVVIRLPNSDGTCLKLFARHGLYAGRIGGDSVDLAETGNPLIKAYLSGEVRLVADMLAEHTMQKSHAAAREHDLRSAVLVPLVAGTTTIATMSVVGRSVGHFDDEFANLLAELARDLVFAREKLAAQRALEEAGQRYESLVESSFSGVVVVDGGVIEYANHGFARMLGYATPAEMRGVNLLDLMAPEFRRRAGHAIRQLNIDPCYSQPPAQIRLRRRDGSLIDVQISAGTIAIGGRTRIQAELRDITRERRAYAEIRALNRSLEARIAERTAEVSAANRELEATNRDLESFSYSVAHDLRGPLRSMMGFANLLQLDVQSGALDALPDHVGRISASAMRMSALIDGLLAVARVTHGALAETRIDSAAMVAELVRELRPSAKVQFDIGPLPAVSGDPAALRQVWSNLLSNAVKYSARKAAPRISVACERSATELVFRVRDNGAGFDPSHAGRLFGVFQRLHTSSEFEGTGVGLAIVRRIVERHGGRCWAEGRPDEGATFHFALPLSRAAGAAG